MSRPKERNAFLGILSGLAWPFFIGGAISLIFYALIYRGPLNQPAMHRYFAAHPVLFAETVLFFVGLAGLALKVLDVLGQYVALNAVTLDDASAAGEGPEHAEQLLDRLAQLPALVRQSYLGRRLRDALQQVHRKHDATGLDGELKYLSDLDVGRQQESYGLVRIVIWATPMLGFLGTVIGITQALGDLDPKLLATNIQLAMEALLSGLYVAFDTTALALTLSMILMFIQFLIDRVETQLLSLVDIRSNELLIGRFAEVGGGNDPHVATVERMSQAVVRSTENLLERQVQLWEGTIAAAHKQWSQLVPAAGQQLQESVGQTLERSLAKFAAELIQAERQAANQATVRWEQWQTLLSDNARQLQAQQQEMGKQGVILTQVLKVTGDVIGLERTLNENLKALSGAKNFEDMVFSLTAAIHLLSARLGGAAASVPQVDLSESRTKGRAA